MLKLSENTAITYAKEFTLTALEHSIIKGDNDPKVSAKNVATFYKELLNSLLKED